MAPRKESHRRRTRSGWWFDVFDEMERMDRLMDDMMRRAVEMPKASEGASPFVYGFSMSVGPDGKPVIREFGNVEPGARGPLVKEEREPLVDVMDSGKEVVVVTELPGEEKILEGTGVASHGRPENREGYLQEWGPRGTVRKERREETYTAYTRRIADGRDATNTRRPSRGKYCWPPFCRRRPPS